MMANTALTKTVTLTVNITLVEAVDDESKIRQVIQSVIDCVPHDNIDEVELVEFFTDNELLT